MVTVNMLNNSRAASLPPLGNIKNATSAEGTSLHCWPASAGGAWLPWSLVAMEQWQKEQAQSHLQSQRSLRKRCVTV